MSLKMRFYTEQIGKYQEWNVEVIFVWRYNYLTYLLNIYKGEKKNQRFSRAKFTDQMAPVVKHADYP